MKISTCSHSTPEIEIIEINGELTGRGALRFERYLYSSLDEGRILKIINLKYMKKADGLGLNALENFINRGMRIRFFNAGLEMLNLLKIAGKEDIIRIYNCQKPEEAVLLFEKEILEEKNAFRAEAKGRRFERVNTSLEAEFKCHTSQNGEIAYKAVIENLSDGGFLLNKIKVTDNKKEENVNALQMINKELSGINFSLNGDSRFIENNGECVWKNKENEELCVGVRFKNMKQSHIETIKDYLYEQKNNKNALADSG